MKIMSNRAYRMHRLLDYFGVIILIISLLFLWQLYRGPIEIPFLKPYIIKALNHDDAAYQVTLDSVNLEFVRSIKPIKIIANNVSYRKNDDSFAVLAPKTSVSFSIRALLHGVIAPSNIEVSNPSIYVFTNYGTQKSKPNEITQKKIGYYLDYFQDFVERFNAEDLTYSESYINGIEINNATVEFHEVDLGKMWAFSDLNYKFSRNMSNISSEINGLVKIDEKLSSVGVEAEYRPYSEKLALEFYFSDIVPSQFAGLLMNPKLEKQFEKVNLPLSGKLDVLLNLKQVIKNKSDVAKSVDNAIEKVVFSFESGQGSILFAEEDKYKYDLSSLLLEGEITGGMNKISIKDATLKLNNQETNLSFELSGLKKYFLSQNPEDIQFSLLAKIKKLKFDDLYGLWPRYLAEDAWVWCEDSLYGGEAHNAKFDVRFGYDKKQKAVAFKDFYGEADFTDMSLNYLRGMPDIHNIYGHFNMNTKELNVSIDKGTSNGVIMTGGSVRLYDLDKYNNYADIKILAESSITDALKLIDNPPLGYTSEMGLKPESMQGTAVTDLGLKFELKNNLGTDEVDVSVKSTLKDVVIPKVIKEYDIQAAQLDMNVTNAGMLIKGKVKLDGFPLDLVWDENFAKEKDYNSKYQLSFMFDQAFKKKWGINYEVLNPPFIDGASKISAEIFSYPQDKMKIGLKADLTAAALDFSFLGLKKKSQETAEVSALVDIAQNKIQGIPSLKFTKPDFSLDGNISFDQNQKMQKIVISNISAPKTAAKAQIEFLPKDKTKINISGTSYDLSAFFADDEEQIKKVKKQKPTGPKKAARPRPKSKLEDVDDTDINIAVNKLWTSPHSMIRNFAGSAKLEHNIGIKEMRIVGNFEEPNSYLRLNYIPRSDKEFVLDVDSNNAGSTLKFLRIYDNMKGGKLNISARRGENKDIIGHAKIRDFSVHNTPVLARLLTIASLSGMVNMLTGEGLKFSHFDAPFTYSDRVLSAREAKAFGNVLGITANGSYDFYYDEFDVKGVVAPAYSLNNIISKIPVVGNLLSGKDGTVFAANYSIEGDLENPQININPLSALSPSSLKDLLSSVFGEKKNEQNN